MFDMGICIDFAAINFENLLLHTQEVTGSSPAVSTMEKSPGSMMLPGDFLFQPTADMGPEAQPTKTQAAEPPHCRPRPMMGRCTLVVGVACALAALIF